MKKHILKLGAMLMSIVLLLSSSWLVSTSANTENKDMSITVSTVTITDKQENLQDIAVNIVLANTKGLASASMWLSYDNSIFYIKSINDGGILGSPNNAPQYTAQPYMLSWWNMVNTNYTTNGTLSTVVFAVKDGAVLEHGKEYVFGLEIEELYDADDNDVTGCIANSGSVTISHDLDETKTKGATCLEDGGVWCNGCGEYIVTSDDYKKKEHNWVKNDTLSKKETCEEDGYDYYECDAGCNDHKTVPIDNISGHDYSILSNDTSKTYSATYYAKGNEHWICSIDSNHTKDEEIDKLIDNVAPSGKISIGTENWWDKLLETISFGIYKKEITFTISDVKDNPDADGDGTGVGTVSYYVSNTALTEAQVKELADSDWTDYSSPVALNGDKNYVVYAKITDKSIDNNGGANVTYISTNGLVIDTAVPVISVDGDGKDDTYCADTTVKISDDNLSAVYVNEDNKGAVTSVTLTEAGEYKIEAEDKAGNKATKTVTIAGEHDMQLVENHEKNKPTSYAEAGNEHKQCSICGYEEDYPIDKLIDNVAPTGTITVKENNWKEFFHSISFGLFYKENLDVTITAEDPADNSGKGTGVKSIEYIVSEKAMTLAEVQAATNWSTYSAFSLEDSKDYVIYAKIADGSIDNNGGANVTYISSKGFVIDKNAPVVKIGDTVAENNKTYYGDTTVTVDESNVEAVTDKGTPVTLTDGKFTIIADNASHIINVIDKAKNETTVQFNVNKNYTVTFVADGKTVATKTIGHGQTLTDIPAVPTKTGYDDKKWDTTDFTNIAGNMTVNAVYTPNKYTATLNGGTGYTLTSDNTTGEVYYDGTYTFTLKIADGYSKTDAFAVKVNGTPVTGNNDVYSVRVTGNVNVTVEGVEDITAPKVKIEVATNKWAEFLNSITFKYFFKATQTVTITATDVGSGVKSTGYYLATEEMTKAELDNVTFTSYSNTFNIDPNNAYIIYAVSEDNDGNKTYVSSEGIVLDNIAPAVSGIENDKIYCDLPTISISGEPYGVTVTMNGQEVAVYEVSSGNYVADSVTGENMDVVVTDKAGNATTISNVTIYDTGHVVSDWTVVKEATETENGEKTGRCDHCGQSFTIITGKRVSKLETPKNAELSAAVEGVDGITFDENTNLFVNDLTEIAVDEHKADIEKAIKDIKGNREIAGILTFDLNLSLTDKDSGEHVTDNSGSSLSDGKFKVTIDIPENLTSNYKSLQLILRDMSNFGKAVEVPFTIENGKAVFVTDITAAELIFTGVKVVTETPKDNTPDGENDNKNDTTTKSPATADAIQASLILVFAVLALAAVFFLKKRKLSK